MTILKPLQNDSYISDKFLRLHWVWEHVYLLPGGGGTVTKPPEKKNN